MKIGIQGFLYLFGRPLRAHVSLKGTAEKRARAAYKEKTLLPDEMREMQNKEMLSAAAK